MDSVEFTRRIDAHHHLWHYTAEEFGWIDDSMAALRRDFLLADLREAMAPAHVDATVAVQARQTVEETEWLLRLAEQAGSPIVGVVGWLPLASPDIEAHLERFAARPYLKALRHVVQGEPQGFLDGRAFEHGIARLRAYDLVYDVLIYARQLVEATRFVDRHPSQPFVLDHIGKPDVRSGERDAWARGLRELSRRENVCCKVSGIVTEAGFATWTEAQLKPYFEVVLEAFGPGRLMIGTDWPVLQVASSYAAWWSLVEGWIAPLSGNERAAILGGNAERVYDLQPRNARLRAKNAGGTA